MKWTCKLFDARTCLILCLPNFNYELRGNIFNSDSNGNISFDKLYQAYYTICQQILKWLVRSHFPHYWPFVRDIHQSLFYTKYFPLSYSIDIVFILFLIISMAKCRTTVTPLLTHWRYWSLALNYWYHIYIISYQAITLLFWKQYEIKRQSYFCWLLKWYRPMLYSLHSAWGTH